jgi:adenosylcobinamide-phosphate synthase
VTTALAVILALIIDRLIGDPHRFHPLAGFGFLAVRVENKMNRKVNGFINHLYGVLSLLVIVVPFVFLAYFFIQIAGQYSIVINAFILAIALGARSMAEHANNVLQALRQNDLETARQKVGMIVSRDTGSMNKNDVIKATVESVLENGNDAVFSTLFWFVILGAPGVVLFRLTNTLDAMWGYRNERFKSFGWAAARLDDVLNWIPARLTALTYAMLGQFKQALTCWQEQASLYESPNAGVVMASGAGALGIKLGGAAVYAGKNKQRPQLGIDREVDKNDIQRAISLLQQGIILWVVVILAGGWWFA